MSIHQGIKIFGAPHEAIPPYILEKNLAYARAKIGDIGNYSASVFYALTGELQDDSKAKRVLKVSEEGPNQELLSAFVGQRPGTITPWSSKVDDVLKGAGVTVEGRVERIIHHSFDSDVQDSHEKLGDVWYDKMMQTSVPVKDQIRTMFEFGEKQAQKHIDILENGIDALNSWNDQKEGLLSKDQVIYLFDLFSGKYKRNPTDTELFGFGQGNSEHCYHGTFNGMHVINGEKIERSFFDRIKNTHKQNPGNVLSAYKDNASAVKGSIGKMLIIGNNGVYGIQNTSLAHTLKVESHNHPTHISPGPGSATGTGGVLRDAACVGPGSQPNAVTSGYATSHLDTPDKYGGKKATPSQIMIQGPLGASAYSNEFGVPAIGGFFRVFDQEIGGTHWGYDKPTMLAGAKGTVFESNIEKKPLPVGTLIIQLGGPGMRIGVGGGSGASADGGAQSAELDFANVQRPNPEMQRRCQEVIDKCSAMQEDNIILENHDIGAGGVGNAVQEMVYDSQKGAIIFYDNIPVTDPTLSPLETWSNEGQERVIVALHPDNLGKYEEICKRENAPFAVIGQIQEGRQFTVKSESSGEIYIDVNIDDFLGHGQVLELEDSTIKVNGGEVNLDSMKIGESISKVMTHPSVGDKSFLITIGDRTVKGRTIQDQMVGPWQVPVSNVGVTLHGIEGIIGEVITQGERAPLAVVNPGASVRIALTEALTNLMSTYIADWKSIQFSGNWMAAKSYPGQLAAIDEGVSAAEQFCLDLQKVIPVGKDSLSMMSTSQDGDTVVSPLTFIATVEAETPDVYKTLTPELQQAEKSELFLIDLGEGKNRIGGSILAQVHNEFGNEIPNIENPELIGRFMLAMQELHKNGLLLAYHDRSDGGLFATLSEMAFASHAGLDIDISHISAMDVESYLRALFSEEPGVVLQIDESNIEAAKKILKDYRLERITSYIGKPNFKDQVINIGYADEFSIFSDSRVNLQKEWSRVNLERRMLQGNPETAQQEYNRIDDEFEPPMQKKLTFDIKKHAAHAIIADYEKNDKPKPKIAILRTQGTNGHEEMARYYMRCGFDVFDIHLNDLMSGIYNLSNFSGIAIPGGFSFGDVLGAGSAFARVIEENENIANQFRNYKGFIFGVCNGCQVISQLKSILPDGDKFPDFKRNDSALFEARKSSVLIGENPDSIFLKGMDGSLIPVLSSHAEGKSKGGNLIPNLRYIDHRGKPTTAYPHNPNGSEGGATGYEVGNIFFMMGHPEREPDPESPWLQIPLNLRVWVEEQKEKGVLDF